MMYRQITFIVSILLLCTILVADEDIFEESLEDLLSMETEVTADVGSRSGAVGFLNSNSPVDIIKAQQIEKSGLTSLTDVLRYFVAGFNAPQTSVADGSDHVRVFTLRGMSPDQTLVLVNGKRLHTSALLHVNGTIGRGSSGVDLDTIAIKSIEKIEILRDGAAAQYGSDAIAGVINIILKGIGHKNSASIHIGQRKDGDGTQVSTDIFISTPLKYDGFVNLTLQAKNQQATQHAGPDNRVNAPVGIQTHVGIPDSKNFLAVLNVEIPQENNFNVYTNILFNYRDSEASTFSRVADPARPIYPEGFLPLLRAEIIDYSLTGGIKGEFSDGYYWDLSNVFGYNTIKYSMKDTMNFSLGNESPTSFDNGSLRFMQNTTNLDIKKNINMFDLAAGIEYREESYKIKAGDIASYVNGGSQGFSGYQDSNAVDESRNSYALYLDAKYDVFTNLFSQLALRYEDFSDFGDTMNVKLVLKYIATNNLLFRTSASTGFRAPSLAQSNYSHSSSFGGIREGTFRVSDEVSKLLGAEALKAEKSKHLTLGGVYKTGEDFYIMIDYFLVDIADKIMLSNEFTLTPAQQVQFGVNKARFFTNALNTRTQGIDVKINHKYILEDDSSINMLFWYNYTKNKVTGFNDISMTRVNSFEQVDRIENGQPKDSIRLLTTYKVKDIDTTLNISRYGSYSQVRDNVSYNFEPAWTADLDVSYTLKNAFILSVGGHNIFDTIPNTWDGLTGDLYGSNGIKQYSRYSPFGYSGAYYYVRASIEF